MSLSIVIPVYFDRIELYPIIQQCLDSITRKDYEVITVDDGSPLYLDLPMTYKHAENKGYTFAVNTGLQMATGDKIWVCNDDVTFNEEILDKMDTIEDDTIYLPRWGGDSMDDDKFGFFWGLTRKTLDKLGYLDESMPHFFSDLDLWKRAKQMGIKIVKWPIVVLHVGSASYQGNQQKFIEGQKAYEKKWGQVD